MSNLIAVPLLELFNLNKLYESSKYLWAKTIPQPSTNRDTMAYHIITLSGCCQHTDTDSTPATLIMGIDGKCKYITSHFKQCYLI